jgi:predicted dehydrogenase
MFRQPTDVAWDSDGNIYITDGYVNSRVAKYDKNGDWVKSWELLRTGHAYLGAAARAAARTPPGHPEGYLEAFANLYRNFIADVRRVGQGQPPARDYPGVEEGLRGLRFVTQAVASSQAGSVWMRI